MAWYLVKHKDNFTFTLLFENIRSRKIFGLEKHEVSYSYSTYRETSEDIIKMC
jgi:hypothetical protein